jgi:hypothetical protein
VSCHRGPANEGKSTIGLYAIGPYTARMDIHQMLADLRSERERLSEAIIVIERLAVSGGKKRRGRPPKWMAAIKAAGPDAPTRKRRPFSADTRKKMAAAQKKRWAAKKKPEAAS